MERIVLHVDIDAFFCQVEELRDPSLEGIPFAVQQHQDIIAVNYPARAAGVQKHMVPSEARQVLGRVGGRLVHVHSEAGGRISYRPYREKGAQLILLLQSLPWAANVEQASIDEAFIEVHHSIWGGTPQAGAEDKAAVARSLALDLRHKVVKELGLRSSVGIAPNKLLAKLASAAAKPDGLKQALLPQEISPLLAATPASRLPGMGGKTAEAFALCAVQYISDLEQYSAAQLQQMLGVKPATAQQLHGWCRGVDHSPVQARPPPRTLSLQMSLTPTLRPMHPSQGQVSASGGKAGLLEPMVVGRPEYSARLAGLIAEMAAELLERVHDDAQRHGRWPHSMAASLRAMGAGRDAFVNTTCAFPSPSLPPASLDQAVAGNFRRLASQASEQHPRCSALVELRLAATAFGSFQAAAAAPPITSFFSPVRPSRKGRKHYDSRGGDPAANLTAAEDESEDNKGEPRIFDGNQAVGAGTDHRHSRSTVENTTGVGEPHSQGLNTGRRGRCRPAGCGPGWVPPGVAGPGSCAAGGCPANGGAWVCTGGDSGSDGAVSASEQETGGSVSRFQSRLGDGAPGPAIPVSAFSRVAEHHGGAGSRESRAADEGVHLGEKQQHTLHADAQLSVVGVGGGGQGQCTGNGVEGRCVARAAKKARKEQGTVKITTQTKLWGFLKAE